MVEDFDAWYLELHPSLGSALLAWCGAASVASDSLDEAFVRSYERWDRVRRMESPAGWVWRTATNVVRRKLRRRDFEQAVLRRQSAGESTVTHEPSADELDLRQALLTLTQRQRTAIVLRYVADLPLREIGAVMGIAEGTVSATLHQGKSILAARLAGPGAAMRQPGEPPVAKTDGGSMWTI